MNSLAFQYKCWRIRRLVRDRDLRPDLKRHVDRMGQIDLKADAETMRFVAFDTEMTGLGEHDRLVAISGIRIEHGRLMLQDAFYEILNPEQEMERQAILVHHIVPDDIAGRPNAAEALPGFLDFIGADILVGHNAAYDREFINRELMRYFGIPLLNPIVDIMLLSRTESHLIQKYRRGRSYDDHSLNALAERFGLDQEDRHTAFGDAITSGLIFIGLMKSLKRFGVTRLNHMLKAGGLA
jgi:DNA polymerase-3 subunit epsilon